MTAHKQPLAQQLCPCLRASDRDQLLSVAHDGTMASMPVSPSCLWLLYTAGATPASTSAALLSPASLLLSCVWQRLSDSSSSMLGSRPRTPTRTLRDDRCRDQHCNDDASGLTGAEVRLALVHLAGQQRACAAAAAAGVRPADGGDGLRDDDCARAVGTKVRLATCAMNSCTTRRR